MKNGCGALIMLSLAITFAGCNNAGTEVGKKASHNALEQSGTWQLLTMTVKGETITRPEEVQGTLQFANGRVSGTGSCNAFEAPAKSPMASFRLATSYPRLWDAITWTLRANFLRR